MQAIQERLLPVSSGSTSPSIPTVLSCKPKTPLNKEFLVIDFAISTNYLPYVGILRALAILWCLVLMSFYNMYVYYLAAFSGDFASYTLIAIYKIFTYFMGLSAKRSRKNSEHNVFLFGQACNTIIDGALLCYDFSLSQFPPYFQFLQLGLDIYILVVAWHYRHILSEYHDVKHTRKLGPKVTYEEATQNHKLNMTKVNYKSRTHYARKLLKSYGRYGSFLITAMTMWVFIDLMGMQLTTIISGPSPQTPVFFNAFLHFISLSIGLYAFYRRQYHVKLSFCFLMVPLVLLDFFALGQEIKQAYNNNFIPFNYVVITAVDLYLLADSIKYALALHNYHEAVKHFKQEHKISVESPLPYDSVKIVHSQASLV